MGKTQTAEEKIRQEGEELDRAYSRLFSTPDGKKVLKDLEQQCFMGVSTFNDSANGVNNMLIREGCRRVFLRIAQKIRMDLSEFYLKRQEAPALPREAVVS